MAKKKTNGSAPTLQGAGLGYRYLSTARALLEEADFVTRAELRAHYEEQENHALLSDETTRPWTDEEHAQAWQEVLEHDDFIDGGGDEESVSLRGADDAPPSSHANGSNGRAPIDPYAATRYLECELTKAEIDALREEREAGDAQIDQLGRELAEVKEKAKSLQKRIDVLTEDGLTTSRKIRSGVEMRDVPCEERRELDERDDSPTKGTLVVVTYRLDTNEAIDWRELRPGERQGRLFEEAPAASPRNGGVEVREAQA